MKGYATEKTKLRRKVFAAIAKYAYEGGGPEEFDELPYRIITGEDDPYRDSIFLERALVGERLRVAMGMSLRPINEHAPASKGVDMSMVDKKYYEPPLIDIIRFACNCCPDNRVFVTDGCQGCLEHPCREVCPKKCISTVNGRSVIDQEKCIKCGRCMHACQYSAIIKQERPCVKACGIGAIHEDDYGHAEIDQQKCVQCGMCLNVCPFAAIVDKGQIYQTIKALQSDTDVYAIIAPAIAGQFGRQLTDTKMKEAFGILGFKDVIEVAVGADLCTIEEAEHFMRDVPEKLPFMCTSCCPAWSIMAKKEYPEFADTVSMAMTPMVLTARLVKKKYPDCKIAFIGPCLSKKNEASRRSVKSYVDFTLTFEEIAGMFEAKDVDFAELEDGEPLREASRDGYGYAKSGGVAQAVANYIKKKDPSREVKIARAEGLAECRKMLEEAKTGKYDGYLLEGMACPGGCIGGAGTMIPLNRAEYQLGVSVEQAGVENAIESHYADWLPSVENLDREFAEFAKDSSADD
jgi:[FeFe] hydrogenase (group B1/B3)